MNTNPRNQFGRLQLHVLLIVLLFLGGAALWWLPDVRARFLGWDSRIKVAGTLTPGDVAEIRRIVRHERWRGVLPQFSWWSIRVLPTRIRFRLSERISQVCANADGTVEVWTEVKGQSLFTKRSQYWTDRKFILKKMKKEWQIITTSYYDHCEG